MRLAIVLHGIVGGMGGRNGLGQSIDTAVCAKTIHHFFDRYNPDFFLHSWSTDQAADLTALYPPKAFQFQPQEYFQFPELKDSSAFRDENRTHRFRTVSRHTSLWRGIQLLRQYEEEHGFRYDWVLVLRYDLVFLRPLELETLDIRCFYVPQEPHWPAALIDGGATGMVHDVFFLANSVMMEQYARVAEEIGPGGKYEAIAVWTHQMTYQKLREMYPGTMWDLVQYGGYRYVDYEVYRLAMLPETNLVGQQYGASTVRGKIEQLLKEIDNVPR